MPGPILVAGVLKLLTFSEQAKHSFLINKRVLLKNIQFSGHLKENIQPGDFFDFFYQIDCYFFYTSHAATRIKNCLKLRVTKRPQ